MYFREANKGDLLLLDSIQKWRQKCEVIEIEKDIKVSNWYLEDQQFSVEILCA